MYQSTIGKTLWITSVITIGLSLICQADNAKVPFVDVRYRLIDLGEADIPPDRLTRKSAEPSLAPVINNAGQIIGNRKEGGFLRDPVLGEWVPYVHDVTINFHALSNKGDVLVTLNRKSNNPEWMVWPSSGGKNGLRQRINVDAFPNSKPIFTGLTNNRKAVGNLYTDGNSQPVLWKPDEDLHFLVDDAGKVVSGEAKWINNKGQLVGYFNKQKDTPPAVWSKENGLEFIRNYRSKPVPDGEADLADILIAEDGTVYGTYRIKYPQGTKDKDTEFYSYAWLPYEGGGFKVLDLEGMRLTGLNEWHALVGTLDGKAAVVEPGQKPVQLSKLIKRSDQKNWELLEATSINNWGDIVGYGKFNGNMHLFLAEKINSQAPYVK